MKKILAFAAVAVAAVTLASADPLLVGHGYFGVGLGSQVLDRNGEEISNTEWNFASNLDFGAGIGVNIPFGGYFGVQPGVDFYVNNVGFAQKSSDGVATVTYMTIDIPILFTAKVNKFNFAIGPYVSIPVGDISLYEKYSSGSLSYEDTVKCDHSWGSIGLTLGAGYEERLGMGRLVIGGRYMLDFIPIEIKQKDSDNVMALSYRRALAIDVAYKLPLSF